MRIILTGPVCSGKSTLGRKLAARYGMPYISIDQIRKEVHADKTKLTASVSFVDQKHHDNYLEKIAVNRFHRELMTNPDGVFETSGYGKTFKAIDPYYITPLLHFHLKCSPGGLEKRLRARLKTKYEWGPVPRHWAKPGVKQADLVLALIKWMASQPDPELPVKENYVRQVIDTGRLSEEKVLDFCRDEIEDFVKEFSDNEQDYFDHDGLEAQDVFDILDLE